MTSAVEEMGDDDEDDEDDAVDSATCNITSNTTTRNGMFSYSFLILQYFCILFIVKV